MTSSRRFVLCALLLAIPAVHVADAAAQAATPWWPASGTIMLGGGGIEEATAAAFVDRLIALAGGPDAIIVIIPTASDGLPARLPAPGPEPRRIADLRRHFESRGARHVVFLHTRDRRVADSEEFVRVLRTANAVFMPGGRSQVLDRTYHGTLVERELKALMARGGVVAGDSAGAIAIGCVWIGWRTRTSPLGPVSEGMCLLPELTVTPHVRPTDARIGEDEMTDSVLTWLVAHPRSIGVSIQENAVLVLHGGLAEVLGRGGVAVFDASKDRARPWLHLAAGAHRDLTR